MRQLKNFCNKKSKTVDDKEIAEQYIGKYKGFTEDQLIEELLKAIKNSKENGTYNEQQMQMFVEMVSPQLNETQKAKLDNMIKMINEEIKDD